MALIATPQAKQVGREQTAGLRALVTRRPITAAVLIAAAFILMGIVIGAVAKAVVPPVRQLPDFIAQAGLIVALVALVTALGWWRIVGYTRPAQWRELRLLWLPLAVMLVLPLARGIALPTMGTLAFWIVGYALTGFYEETLMRGVVLRVLRPRGPTQAVLISALLFGLLHISNLALRSPVIVLAQMVGAATEGVGLAALRLRTNTLWTVIAVHAVEDLVLKLSALPVIPVNVVQSIIMFAYGLYLLRGLHRRAADAKQTPSEVAHEALRSTLHEVG
jgi:uncharacterized protein